MGGCVLARSAVWFCGKTSELKGGVFLFPPFLHFADQNGYLMDSILYWVYVLPQTLFYYVTCNLLHISLLYREQEIPLNPKT
jgi:hypothetical protein